MKVIITVIALSILTLFTSPSNAGEPFTLCYEDQNYPPYLIGESEFPAEPQPGLLVELTKIAFLEADLNVTFIRRPWKRCMRMVKENHAAGMFGVIYNKEREKIGVYPMKSGQPDISRRLMTVDYPIFHHKDATILWDGNSFRNKNIKLGTPLGYATVKSLKSEQKINANTTFLPDTGLTMVAQNKLDGYIVEKNVGQAILKKKNISNIVIAHTQPFKRHNLHLLLSHGFYDEHTEKAEKIWSTLAVLRETVLDELMQTYLTRQ